MPVSRSGRAGSSGGDGVAGGGGCGGGAAGAGGAAARPVRVHLTRAETALPAVLAPPPSR